MEMRFGVASLSNTLSRRGVDSFSGRGVSGPREGGEAFAFFLLENLAYAYGDSYIFLGRVASTSARSVSFSERNVSHSASLAFSSRDNRITSSLYASAITCACLLSSRRNRAISRSRRSARSASPLSEPALTSAEATTRRLASNAPSNSSTRSHFSLHAVFNRAFDASSASHRPRSAAASPPSAVRARPTRSPSAVTLASARIARTRIDDSADSNSQTFVADALARSRAHVNARSSASEASSASGDAARCDVCAAASDGADGRASIEMRARVVGGAHDASDGVGSARDGRARWRGVEE